MRNTTRGMLASLLLLSCISVVGAERKVAETVPAQSGGTVSIELIAGSVRFVGWDRDEVEITGTLEDDVEGLDIESVGKRILIEVEIVDRSHHVTHASADLQIRVPRNSHIEAESVSADFEVESVRGPVAVESVSGDVRIRGEITEAEVATVSSSIRVESDTELESGEFETVSGRIDFRGALSSGGRFSFESMSGDVTLRLPGGTSAEFDVETFSGDIDNDLGPQATRTDRWTPGKNLNFTLGSGAARVSVESFSGRVRLMGQ